MNILDIICLVFLGYALYRGVRNGLVVELSGVLALLVGVWAAFRYGATVGLWVGLEESTASVGGFILLLVAVVIFIMLLSRVLRSMIDLMGLGLFDKFGGALVSMLKTAIVLSLLLGFLIPLNNKNRWVKQEVVEQSYLSEPLMKVNGYIFPFLERLKGEYLKQLGYGEDGLSQDKSGNI